MQTPLPVHTYTQELRPLYSRVLSCTPYYWRLGACTKSWDPLYLLPSVPLSTVGAPPHSHCNDRLLRYPCASVDINRCNNWMIAPAFVIFSTCSYFLVLFSTFCVPFFWNDWYPCYSSSGCNNWIIGCTMASQTSPLIKYGQANSRPATHVLVVVRINLKQRTATDICVEVEKSRKEN